MIKLTAGSYDPEYSDYEFGKISALREIALTSEGNYQYYYMGTKTTFQFAIVAINCFFPPQLV